MRGGLRRDATGFESELRRWFQGRLELLSLFTLIAAGAMLVVSHVTALLLGTWELARAAHVSTYIHIGSCLVAASVWLAVRGEPRPAKTLQILDAVLFGGSLATILGIYATSYSDGMPVMGGVLALFVLARALILPSTVRRTVLYSICAPLGFLAIQLAHGVVYAWPGQLVPADYEVYVPIWNQVVLWLAVVMAAFASHLNYTLRVKAYEAKQLDQYIIESKLGAGGMGDVYRARHALMRRPTAVKVLRPDVTGTRALQRFEKEVRQTSRLTHPNTIRIYDYGRTPEGDFYYAMELLDGADLERLVELTGPLAPARAIHVLVQACSALHEAHEAGLVHRDVKPSNILLCIRGLEHDVVKVMDFGLVKDTAAGEETLTRADEICGSPQTISPEALKAEEVTRRSDLYALGAVGCYLLTGKPPFDGRTVVELAAAHLHKPPIAPSARDASVPQDLEAVLLTCLAKEPDERPATALIVREALLACADAGAWSAGDAARWWGEHAERVTGTSGTEMSGDGDTARVTETGDGDVGHGDGNGNGYGV